MVIFGSFRDCADKSVLNCLQAFNLRRVDAVKKGDAQRIDTFVPM